MTSKPAASVVKKKKRSKPWRYAYAFVFELDEDIPDETLKELLAKSSQIEKEEESYLDAMSDMNPLNRSQHKDSPLHLIMKRFLRQTNTILAVLSVLSLFWSYYLVHSDWGYFCGDWIATSMVMLSTVMSGMSLLGLMMGSWITLPPIMRLYIVVMTILCGIQLDASYQTSTHVEVLNLMIQKQALSQPVDLMNQNNQSTMLSSLSHQVFGLLGLDPPSTPSLNGNTNGTLMEESSNATLNASVNNNQTLMEETLVMKPSMSNATLNSSTPVLRVLQSTPFLPENVSIVEASESNATTSSIMLAQGEMEKQILETMALGFDQILQANVSTWFFNWAKAHCDNVPVNITDKIPFEACKPALTRHMHVHLELMLTLSLAMATAQAFLVIFASIFLLTRTKAKKLSSTKKGFRQLRKENHSSTKKHRERGWSFYGLYRLSYAGTFLLGLGLSLGLVYTEAYNREHLHLVSFLLLPFLVIFVIAKSLLALGAFAHWGIIHKDATYLRWYYLGMSVISVLAGLAFVALVSVNDVLDMILSGDPRLNMPESQVVLQIVKATFPNMMAHVSWFRTWAQTYGCGVNNEEVSFDTCERALARPAHDVLNQATRVWFWFWCVQVCQTFYAWYIWMTFPVKFKFTKTDTSSLVQKNNSSRHPLVEADSDSRDDDLIGFQQALHQYTKCIPVGFPERKQVAKRAFRELWKIHAQENVHEEYIVRRRDDDRNMMMPVVEYHAIVRELMIQRLTEDSQLDLSFCLSRDGKFLFCKVAASERVLAQEADRLEYQLFVHRHLDPGYHTFWKDPREVEKDRRVYSAETVRNKLSALYAKDQIPKSEYRVFPFESLAEASTRVNVHERINQPNLKISNDYPAFVQYTEAKSKQYLYQRYRTKVDGDTHDRVPSIFRTVDRLKLIQSLIEDQYDLVALQELGLVHSYFALHSASKYDVINLNDLYEQWITFWRPYYLKGELKLNWCILTYLRRIYPFRQPITSIKDYFGEKIALYFRWIGFYAQMLMFPALCAGVCMYWSGHIHAIKMDDIVTVMTQPAKTSFEGHISIETQILTVLVLAWAMTYVKVWQAIMSPQIACQWGMTGFEAREKPRPQFHGVMEYNPRKRIFETNFPTRMRTQRQIVSFFIVLACAAVVGLSMLGLMWIQNHMISVIGSSLGTILGALGQALAIELHQWWYLPIGQRLNHWENYRTETEYEDALIMKIFFFQVINYYSALVFTALGKKHVFGCAKVGKLVDTNDLFNEPGKGNCMHELETILSIMFVLRICYKLIELLKPATLRWLTNLEEKRKKKAGGPPKSAKSADSVFDLERELTLCEYENPFEDYTEMVIQYGLVSMFVSSFPLLPIIAFCETTLEIRVDAYKLCLTTRRPFPTGAQGIGVWQHYLNCLTRLALVMNTALYLFTADNCTSWPLETKLVVFFGSSLTLCLVFELILRGFPDVPSWISNIQRRHEFIAQRYLKSRNVKIEPPTTSSSFETLASADNFVTTELEDYREERSELLEQFNAAYEPSSSMMMQEEEEEEEEEEDSSDEEGEPVIEPAMALEGMDAIREAVRRSTFFPPLTTPMEQQVWDYGTQDDDEEETKEEESNDMFLFR